MVLLGRPYINKASGLRNGNYIPPRSEIKLTEEVKQTMRSGVGDRGPSNINRSVNALLFVLPDYPCRRGSDIFYTMALSDTKIKSFVSCELHTYLFAERRLQLLCLWWT